MKTFGQFALLLSLGLAVGCGDGDLAEDAGSAVGETITDFTTGIGEGIDKGMKVTVEISDAAKAKGLSTTVANSDGFDKSISVYVIAEQEFQGRLLAKAIGADGNEMGRSMVDAEFGSDDAKYVRFQFEDAMDSQLVEKYTIDVRPPAEPMETPEAAEPSDDTATE